MSETLNLEILGEVPIYIGVGTQIVAALLLGGMVGYDREKKLKAAGLKTNILICIGATLYTTMSLLAYTDHTGVGDPNRVAAQIVSGIGFLGAGAIIQGRGGVTGLTTASSIWVVAAIGYTIGIGYIGVASIFSLTVLIVLRLVNPISSYLERTKDFKDFHIEVLSKGSIMSVVENLISAEDIQVEEIFEEFHDRKKDKYILSIHINSHLRIIDRLVHAIEKSVRVEKVSFYALDVGLSKNAQNSIKIIS